MFFIYPQGNNWDYEHMERSSDGLLALLLSMRKKPIIRYQQSSVMCKRLAENVMVILLVFPMSFVCPLPIKTSLFLSPPS